MARVVLKVEFRIYFRGKSRKLEHFFFAIFSVIIVTYSQKIYVAVMIVFFKESLGHQALPVALAFGRPLNHQFDGITLRQVRNQKKDLKPGVRDTIWASE